MSRHHLFLILGFVLMAFLGYWLAGTAVHKKEVKRSLPESGNGPKRTVIADEAVPKFRKEERRKVFQRDDEALENGALPGQRILVFRNQVRTA